jgi:uncharacterized protein (DUF1800 family)
MAKNPTLTVCFAAVSLFAFLTSLQAGIDQNNDGLSDIWVLKYNASGLLPNADTDGDGFTNLQESVAGTDPRAASSKPEMAISRQGLDNQLNVAFDTQAGKKYQVFQQTTLQPGGWLLADSWMGSGTPIAKNYPIGIAPQQFYRVGISDKDTTGGGVSDWEKLVLGFNPKTSNTDRYSTSDRNRILSQLTAADTITMGVVDNLLRADWPTPGIIAIRRSGGLKQVTVNFTSGGTAIRGTDYTMQTENTVTFPLGSREVLLNFTPANPILNTSRTIIVTLNTGAGYSLSGTTSASITLEAASPLPSAKSAARFLIQASYGPNSSLTPNALPPNVEALMNQGFPAWIEQQFTLPLGYLQPYADWRIATNQSLYFHDKPAAYWNRILGNRIHPGAPLVTTPDHLRQRMAFALSQIFVISDKEDGLMLMPQAMLNYYDIFIRHGFGNYRDCLRDIAIHPIMGRYLSHLKNRKPDPAANIYPDENFAREVMQLFSIGLWELNPDGTEKLGPDGQHIATYNNTTISNFARVFTGLSYGDAADNNFDYGGSNHMIPMKGFDSHHDLDPKTLLNGVTLPSRNPTTSGIATMLDVEAAIDNLFNHPNTAPFISKQLIQRFVTSNPTPAYVGRVSAAFANNGSGVRGDFKAVLRAILLDVEARNPASTPVQSAGKLREPYLQTANLAMATRTNTPNGIYELNYLDEELAQQILSAPSVFNFFRPGFSPAGPISDQGLVAPEFQIVNSITVLARANYFNKAMSDGFRKWSSSEESKNTRADLSPEIALAGDPDALLRRLNLSLAAGLLSPTELQIIREAITRIDSSVAGNWQLERVRAAIWLIINSPETATIR